VTGQSEGLWSAPAELSDDGAFYLAQAFAPGLRVGHLLLIASPFMGRGLEFEKLLKEIKLTPVLFLSSGVKAWAGEKRRRCCALPALQS